MMYDADMEFRGVFVPDREVLRMYRIIIEMLGNADERQLRLIYVYIRALMGLH